MLQQYEPPGFSCLILGISTIALMLLQDFVPPTLPLLLCVLMLPGWNRLKGVLRADRGAWLFR